MRMSRPFVRNDGQIVANFTHECRNLAVGIVRCENRAHFLDRSLIIVLHPAIWVQVMQ
eukprot:SAG11_NODE_27_length_23309_cov_10.579362_11_plen_58_part_00